VCAGSFHSRAMGVGSCRLAPANHMTIEADRRAMPPQAGRPTRTCRGLPAVTGDLPASFRGRDGLRTLHLHQVHTLIPGPEQLNQRKRAALPAASRRCRTPRCCRRFRRRVHCVLSFVAIGRSWNLIAAIKPSVRKASKTTSWVILKGGSFCVGEISFSAGIFWNNCTTSTSTFR